MVDEKTYGVGQVVTSTTASVTQDGKPVDFLVVLADIANKVDEIHRAVVGKKK